MSLERKVASYLAWQAHDVGPGSASFIGLIQLRLEVASKLSGRRCGGVAST